MPGALRLHLFQVKDGEPRLFQVRGWEERTFFNSGEGNLTFFKAGKENRTGGLFQVRVDRRTFSSQG